jgi:hypothetical protein
MSKSRMTWACRSKTRRRCWHSAEIAFHVDAVNITDQDPRTGRGKRCGQRASDPGPSAGDNGHLVFDVRVCLQRAKPVRQLMFGSVRPQHRGTVLPGQHSARHRIDLVKGNAVYLSQRVANAAMLAVIELAAADSVHPRP